MTKLQVTESPKGYYSIQGELNRNTIAKSVALATLDKNIQKNVAEAVSVLDMADVSHSDTAALAWLMNILKDNHGHNVKIELKNIPESLIKLAKISDVDSFLSVQ